MQVSVDRASRALLRSGVCELTGIVLAIPEGGNQVNAVEKMAAVTGKRFTKDMCEPLRHEVGWETERIDRWIVQAFRFDDSGDIHIVNTWE